MSPYKWPEWDEKPGELTKRGFHIEGLMASYFSQWFAQYEVLPEGCPDGNSFFAYANSVQRTILTATAFVNSAFPNCNIPVHSASIPDPIFNPIIHNDSVIYKKIAETEMEAIINTLRLNTSYDELDYILNYPESEYCKQKNKCHLSQEENVPNIVAESKPKVSGGLKKSKEAIDGFLMAFYNGFPMDQVAWGKLNTNYQWDLIMQLTEGYHDVVYKTESVAKDLAGPLLAYMKNIFLKKTTKVTLLMAHDVNINVILQVMSFKPHCLRRSLISTPVSGKIVFQKWFNKKTGKYLLKVEYIYQNTQQIRNALPLSLENPPEYHLMELNGCELDGKGLCSWDDFVSILNSI